MPDFLIHVAQAIQQFMIATFGAELSSAMGWSYLVSFGTTQFFKMWPRIAHITPKRMRWLVIQSYSIAVCITIMLILYHAPTDQRVIASIGIGFLPPWLYLALAWCVWKVAPWIGKAMSGDPQYLDGLPEPKKKAGATDPLPAILLALGAAAAAAPGLAYAGATGEARLTVHDPLTGTRTYTQVIEQIQYNGALPEQWSVRTAAGVITGTVQQNPQPRYYNVSPGHFRLELTYRAWAPTRIFAAGFEP